MALTRAGGSALAGARRGALLGGLTGVTLAVALLAFGLLGGGEAEEGALVLGTLFGLPLTTPVAVKGWEAASTHWVAFLAITLPLNGLLLGTAAGAFANALGWRPRGRAGIVMLLWFGGFSITWVWAQAV